MSTNIWRGEAGAADVQSSERLSQAVSDLVPGR